MKEEIVNLIDVASSSINELENYLFNNLKEKYVISKSILDDHKEHIEKIRGILEYELTTEDIDMAKKDLTFIIETIKNGKNGLSYGDLNVEEVSNPEILPTETDFDDAEIDALLNALDENEFETVFPKEDINPEAIEGTINNLESVATIQNIDYSNDLDINAMNEFLGTNSENSN